MVYSVTLGIMKLLDGAELAGYIKERQAKQVRNLRQNYQVFPRLAIVRTTDNPVILTYVRKKRQYGQDILIAVDDHRPADENEALELIHRLNDDETVHGIIVQLPLGNTARTDELVNAVLPAKDVDALGAQAVLDPATPMAIIWLLSGYNVELAHKHIVVVGRGRLVGAPLAKMWQDSGLDVEVVDRTVTDLAGALQAADVIVTAAGHPGLITSAMLRPGVVVVDAATASEDGKIVGDVAADVRQRDDLIMTPLRGGVGPLTVCALFDNVIRAARTVANSES